MSAMNERTDLRRRLFGAAGPDSGCVGSGDLLDAFVEAELAGQDAAGLYPAVAAHIASCPDCSEDHDALVALVTSDEGRPQA